eukprot:scaffold277222_cov17-Tisochrysis_lutea.AAC.1
MQRCWRVEVLCVASRLLCTHFERRQDFKFAPNDRRSWTLASLRSPNNATVLDFVGGRRGSLLAGLPIGYASRCRKWHVFATTASP